MQLHPRHEAHSVCDAHEPNLLNTVIPLIVRLPNHLGDACMALPALDLLTGNGYAITLAGQPWAADLFAAYRWPAVSMTGSRRERVRALWRLRNAANAQALLMTNSFGSALDFRLAGIPATGYARDARSWLLRRAIPVEAADHMVEYYYRLAASIVGTSPDVPGDLRLAVSPSARQRARDLLEQHGVGTAYIVLCPVAVGLHRGRIKAWDGFEPISRHLLDRGAQVVAMPGPKETAAVRAALPNAILLPESNVSTFAAVLAGARLVIANDSGPGHLAAAVGAPLISVFGVTEPEKTRPWSSKATLVGGAAGWPRYEDVRAAVDGALSA